MLPPTSAFRRTLDEWRAGDSQAVDAVFALTYDELRAIARRQLAMISPGQTLAPTALVHEIYMRFAERSAPHLVDRNHFLAVAARTMRHVVIDHVRRRRAGKRDGIAVPLSGIAVAEGQQPVSDLLALDEALTQLDALDPRQAVVVEMRFFGGYSFDEIADALKISDRTVKRDWEKARAFLYLALQ
jgi:RNA polymerase sigma factor (TIGR02999 family)